MNHRGRHYRRGRFYPTQLRAFAGLTCCEAIVGQSEPRVSRSGRHRRLCSWTAQTECLPPIVEERDAQLRAELVRASATRSGWTSAATACAWRRCSSAGNEYRLIAAASADVPSHVRHDLAGAAELLRRDHARPSGTGQFPLAAGRPGAAGGVDVHPAPAHGQDGRSGDEEGAAVGSCAASCRSIRRTPCCGT